MIKVSSRQDTEKLNIKDQHMVRELASAASYAYLHSSDPGYLVHLCSLLRLLHPRGACTWNKGLAEKLDK